MKDILSQDEIDALLHGVDDGSVESETDHSSEKESDGTAAYDFTSQERIVRGRLPTLEMINERFVRLYRTCLYSMIRKPIEVHFEGVSMVKYGEYNQGLFVPTSLSLLKIPPLRGTALVMLDPKLVFILVENFFGGSGVGHNKIEGRDFTPTEQRVIRMIIDDITSNLTKAWESVFDIGFEYIGHEVNPNMASLVGSNEIVVVSTFNLELDGGGGPMQLAMPYSMIEPIKELLDAGIQTDRLDADDHWNSAIRTELLRARVEVACRLAEIEITVRELSNLKVGDVLMMDEEPGSVTATVAGLPMIRGRYGKSQKGNASILVNDLVRIPQHENRSELAIPGKKVALKNNQSRRISNE